MYALIAAFEDDFLPVAEYGQYAAAVKSHVRTGGAGVDIGCGGGRLTTELYRAGLSVTGIDDNPAMLDAAARRSLQLGYRIPFVRSDASKGLAGFSGLAFAVAATDVINHIKDPGKLFKSVYERLAAGGVFMFDISSAYKLIEKVADRTFLREEEHFTRVWNNSYIPKLRRIDMEVLYFLRQDDGRYEKKRGNGIQYIWETAEICRRLEAEGFSVTTAGTLNGDAATACSERIYFIAKKAAQ